MADTQDRFQPFQDPISQIWQNSTSLVLCNKPVHLNLRKTLSLFPGTYIQTRTLLSLKKSPSLSHQVDGFSLFSTGLTDKRGQKALGSGLFSDQ